MEQPQIKIVEHDSIDNVPEEDDANTNSNTFDKVRLRDSSCEVELISSQLDADQLLYLAMKARQDIVNGKKRKFRSYIR